MGEDRAGATWYWEAWFAQLKELIEDRQVQLKVLDKRTTGYSIVHWVATGFEAYGGSIVIVADPSKPQDTDRDEDEPAAKGRA